MVDHVLREDAVVIHVVPVLALLLRDRDRAEPLDHAPADVARNEQPHGIPRSGVARRPERRAATEEVEKMNSL